MDPEVLIWLFPMVFMIHEFEEIIFMRRWMSKNGETIANRFPRLGKRIRGRSGKISTEAFSLIVAEEFVIVSGIVIFSAMSDNYSLFGSLVIIYSLHLLGHVVQAAVMRKYVPALATSLLTGIFCAYTLHTLIRNDLLSFHDTLIYSSAIAAFSALNLLAMHRLVKRISILD